MSPHQCVHCGKLYPVASKELVEGCSACKSHFFFYIREDQINRDSEAILEIPQEERRQIEKDVREIVGAENETTPVILDFESVRISGSGKFEIDLVKLFDKKSPVVYKLEEGKYVIDLISTLQKRTDEIKDLQ